MTEDLKRYLIEELKRTGYPLEIEISSLLEGKGYRVKNSEYFFDSDENKAREIDISADHLVSGGWRSETGAFTVSHQLVVECKKSETHAWTFLTRPERQLPLSGQCMDFLTYATMDTEVSFLNPVRELCKECLHYDSIDRVARTSIALRYQAEQSGKKVKQDGKDEILEARNQLVKFVAYDIGKFLKEWGWLYNPYKVYFIRFYHPTIVFDGGLYEAILKDGSVELLEKKHLLFATTYSPTYVSDFKNSISPDLPYLIDVVRKDYFAEFLQILDNEYTALHRCIAENLEKLQGTAKMNLKSSSMKLGKWKRTKC